MEHEFIGHALMKLSDKQYELSKEEKDTLGPVPVEAKLGNIIRREIGIPDRTNYTANNEEGISVEFGYLNGSYEPDPDIKPMIVERSEGGYTTITPPPQYPKNLGSFKLSIKAIQKISTAKYYKSIKYHVYKKTFDFN